MEQIDTIPTRTLGLPGVTFRIQDRRLLLIYDKLVDKILYKGWLVSISLVNAVRVEAIYIAHVNGENTEMTIVAVDFGKLLNSTDRGIFDVENVRPHIRVINSNFGFNCAKDVLTKLDATCVNLVTTDMRSSSSTSAESPMSRPYQVTPEMYDILGDIMNNPCTIRLLGDMSKNHTLYRTVTSVICDPSMIRFVVDMSKDTILYRTVKSVVCDSRMIMLITRLNEDPALYRIVEAVDDDPEMLYNICDLIQKESSSKAEEPL